VSFAAWRNVKTIDVALALHVSARGQVAESVLTQYEKSTGSQSDAVTDERSKPRLLSQ